MSGGIIELDVHGMNAYQAKLNIDSKLKSAKKDTYIVRVIHGFNSGTKLKNMVRKEYRNHPKVIRIETGLNQGITDLILRELY
jgi:DNA-nicking Smr family endonuclease